MLICLASYLNGVSPEPLGLWNGIVSKDMHAGLVFTARGEGGRGVPGWAGKPISACCSGHQAGTWKGCNAPHMAAPFWMCGTQTQAAIQSEKDGGFHAICPVLYTGRHKEAN